MKKRVLFMLTAMLLSLMICTVSFSSSDNYKSVNISNVQKSTVEGLELTTISPDTFNKKNAADLLGTQIIALDKNVADSVDKSLLKSLLDNGSYVAIYGNDLTTTYLYDYFNIPKTTEIKFNNPDTEKNITSVSICKVKGKYVLGGTINKLDDNEKAKHDPFKLFKENFNGVKDSPSPNPNPSKTGQILPKMAPSGWDYIDCNYTLQYTRGTVNPKIYVYNILKTGGTHYWDLVGAFNTTPNSLYVTKSSKIKYSDNYSGQALVDYTWLPSRQSSVQLSLNASGVPTLYWNTSTNGVDVANNYYPQYLYVQWDSTYYGSAAQYSYKLEPGARMSNTIGSFYYDQYFSVTWADTWSGTTQTNSESYQIRHNDF